MLTVHALCENWTCDLYIAIAIYLQVNGEGGWEVSRLISAFKFTFLLDFGQNTRTFCESSCKMYLTLHIFDYVLCHVYL